MKVGNVLLGDEFPEKRGRSVLCSSDLHPLPTDRGYEEGAKVRGEGHRQTHHVSRSWMCTAMVGRWKTSPPKEQP